MKARHQKRDDRYAMLYASEVFSNMNQTEFRVYAFLKIVLSQPEPFEWDAIYVALGCTKEAGVAAVHGLTRKGWIARQKYDDGTVRWGITDRPLEIAVQSIEKARGVQ